MSTAEALARAMSPGANLVCTDRPGSVDYLMALGLVQSGHVLGRIAGAAHTAPFRDLPSLLVRVKIGQHYAGNMEKLRKQLLALAEYVFEREGWRVHDRRKATAQETMGRFVDRLIEEFCFPENCGKCGGRRIIYKRGAAAKVCTTCQGTGIRPEPKMARARALDLAIDGYRRVWEPRFQLMLALLDYIVGVTVGVVRKKVRSDF